jgi:uncharacterized protein (DUF1778 family)
MATVEKKSDPKIDQKSARLSIRLRDDLKALIEEAAWETGQSLSDFAVSTLVRTAREVIEQSRVTRLSDRDRDLFLKLIEDTEAEPNEKLRAAAEDYKKRMRKS